MTLFRWIFAVVVVGAVVLLGAKSLQPRQPPALGVQLATAEKATVTRTVVGAGKLEPVHKVNVSSNITGTLVDLDVGIGSLVAKGQYLGQIDTSRYSAQVEGQRAQGRTAGAEVERARANVEYLRGQEDRLTKLSARGLVSANELEQARAQRVLAEADLKAAQSRSQSAQAGIDEATNSLRWATLTAPVDGTVLGVNHRVGERIRGSDFAEDVVLVLGSLSNVDVRLEIGEHDVVYIKPAQAATIEIDALPDVVVRGEVIDSGRDAIVRNAGTENEVTTFPVWVSIGAPPPAALPGMSAQVAIATETHRDVVAVPIQAVTVRPAQPTPEAATEQPVAQPVQPARPGAKLDKVVFVVEDGVVTPRKVKTGLSSDRLVEITEGLSAGEVVVEGPYRTLARELKPGTHVVEAEEVRK